MVNIFSLHFQCRLRTSSLVLQRWMVALVSFIILWNITYIIYWFSHPATLLGIAQFLLPLLLLPLVCAAYAEVNMEGKRMLKVKQHILFNFFFDFWSISFRMSTKSVNIFRRPLQKDNFIWYYNIFILKWIFLNFMKIFISDNDNDH